MPRARHATVSLSPIREEQLRKVAEINGLSPREQIEEWVRSRLRDMGSDARGCPYIAPPGFSVVPFLLGKERLICLAIEGLPVTLLELETSGDVETPDDDFTGKVREAEDFAEALEASAKSGRPWDYDCTQRGGRHVYVTRQGAAVTIRIDEARKALTPSLAQDLAEAVREVVAKVKTLRGKRAEAAQKTPAGVSPTALREASEIAWP